MASLIECPACRGGGERVHQVYVRGQSPFDSVVRCDVCHGTGQVSQRNADDWRAFPTIPPLPLTTAQQMARGLIL